MAKGREIHNRHDPLWVSDEKRRCVICDDIKLLKCFDPLQKTDGLHVLLECNLCIEKSRAAVAIEKQATAQIEVATALSKAFRRPVARTEGPALSELATKMFEKMGGMDVVAEELGRVTMDTLRDKKVPAAVQAKYASLIVDMLGTLMRHKDEAVDLSQLTDDDLTDMMMPAAKKLLLTDHAFVCELLSDIEIRRKLLSDMGVDLIETTAVGG